MRKKGNAGVVFGLVLLLAMTAGCGKNAERYSYRDAGIAALNQGNYDSALEVFDQAIDSSKGLVGAFDADVLKYRAEAEYLSGDYEAAIQTYDTLMKLDGERAEYFYMLTASKTQAGDMAGAIKDFNQSLTLDPEKKAPGYGKALLAAGTAMEKEGNSSDAMSLYQTALDDGDRSAEIYNQIGLISLENEDWDSAIEYFTKGESAPDSGQVPELMFNKAVAMEYKGDFKMALEVMEQYVSVHGSDEEAEREITFLKTR